MNLIKWLFEEQYSEEVIAAEYAEMSDGKLATIRPSQLSKVGLKCYRNEVEVRRERCPHEGRDEVETTGFGLDAWAGTYSKKRLGATSYPTP